MSIRREIEVTRKGLSRPIDVTYGTNILPIEFMITDFELPEGATAEAYAMGSSSKLVKQSCVISKNIISFIPEIGLFEEGKNVLQLAVTYAGKDLFSFYIPVNCQKTMVYEGAQDLENDPTFVAIVMQMKEDIANKITIPEAAEVGQILEVEEVDENGKPTKFIAVDKPTGSGEGGAGAVALTQAEYDNLSEEEKNADVIYFITDGYHVDTENSFKAIITSDFNLSANGNILELTLPVGTYILNGYIDGASTLTLWFNGVTDYNSDEYLKLKHGCFVKILKVTEEKTVFFKNLTGQSQKVYIGTQMSAFRVG